jgi:hypothetical protein
MIVQLIHAHRVLYVLIQKMDSVVYVHHGKVIALMVGKILIYMIIKSKYEIVCL